MTDEIEIGLDLTAQGNAAQHLPDLAKNARDAQVAYDALRTSMSAGLNAPSLGAPSLGAPSLGAPQMDTTGAATGYAGQQQTYGPGGGMDDLSGMPSAMMDQFASAV